MEVNNTNSWIDDAIAGWKASKTKLQPGVSIKMIHQFETVLQVNFPQDFIDFYTNVNGFELYDWNEHMFSLWPLERIKDEYDSEIGYIALCDFLIDSYRIGILLETGYIYKDFDFVNPIAKSFKEFIILLNKNDDTLY